MSQIDESIADTGTTSAEQGEAAALPKLSAQERRSYNRMADMMELYHNSFRHTWNTLYASVSSPSSSSSPLSARQLIRQGLAFCHHLTTHHTIEEQYFFPILGAKMPEFRPDATPLQQHKEIHKGLDKLEEYLQECQTGERVLRREEVKEKMDLFGAVLWRHLDEEVRFLGADNMRKWWTLREIENMPM